MLNILLARTLQKEKFTVPAIILIIVLLAYGLLIPSMGFYWDDWPFAWLLRFFGPSDFIEAFRPYRPLLGPIFAVTTTLFGGNPVVWQVIGLIVRFLLALEVWSVLRLTWPTQKRTLLWVVLLFTVYPGYHQQWVALTHVNQELIPLMLLLVSFAVTLLAVRNPRRLRSFTILAIVLQVLGLFSTEYFFGLEILRLLLLVFVFYDVEPERRLALRKAGTYWLPYLIVWILNAIWTFAYHRSAAYNSYDISVLSSPSMSLLGLGNEILTTFSLSAFTSWLGTFQPFAVIDGSLTQLLALAILLLSGVLVFALMRPMGGDLADQGQMQNNRWSLQAMLIGAVGIFAGRLPSWAAGLPLKVEFDYDRFMLSIMLGASLFIVGLGTFILKDGKRQIVILSLLIGLSTAYQFTLANTFRRDWANQQDFFWQLAWRMPGLEENTVLLTSELPLKYASDLQTTAALNWMYAPDLAERNMPYALLYIKTRFNSLLLPSLRPDEPITFQYRTVPFSSSTSNVVVIYKDADGCLRVLDPVYGNGDTVPGVSYFLATAIPLSDTNRIQVDASQPEMDRTLFGSEPEHGWCYFYEKAELARQQLDWEQAIKLYKQAQKDDLAPSVPVENLVFIEAYAGTGDVDTALKLTDQTIRAQETLCPAIYTLWDRILQSASGQSFDVSMIEQHIAQSGCKR
ncbi:MAG: hypothetical protein AB1649_20390 [Chloroflexota bacterium]